MGSPWTVSELISKGRLSDDETFWPMAAPKNKAAVSAFADHIMIDLLAKTPVGTTTVKSGVCTCTFVFIATLRRTQDNREMTSKTATKPKLPH